MSDLLITIILGIIEGITEFLPVSSTGHLIVATALLNPGFDAVTAATFNIFIQFGAVLAMIVFYRAELMTQVRTVRTDRSVQRFWLPLPSPSCRRPSSGCWRAASSRSISSTQPWWRSCSSSAACC